MPKTLITTVIDKTYMCYVPLFVYGCNKYHPECDVRIYSCGDICHCIAKEYGVEKMSEALNTGYDVAAMRFVFEREEFKNYDYILITDIDILMGKDDFVKSRIEFMDRFGLECYSNSPSQSKNDELIFPGVHFVTPKWFELTKAARRTFECTLPYMHSGDGFDEKVLGIIVKNSGLKYVSDTCGVMSCHGFHLGQVRKNKAINRHSLNNLQVACDYINDPEFMALITPDMPNVLNIIERLNKEVLFG